jgi:ABC-type phosphate transport system substrate-binding protein
VIVHPSNQSQLDLKEIRRIFLLKVKQFPDGHLVTPIDRQEGSEIRQDFIRQVIGTNENKLKAYWARLLFTGKVILPRTLEKDTEVTSTVASNPGSIGYVHRSAVTGDVRVVSTF